jgi:hypothetical protein
MLIAVLDIASYLPDSIGCATPGAANAAIETTIETTTETATKIAARDRLDAGGGTRIFTPILSV